MGKFVKDIFLVSDYNGEKGKEGSKYKKKWRKAATKHEQ